MLEIRQDSKDNLHYLFFNNELISEAEVWETHRNEGYFDVKLPFDKFGKSFLKLYLAQFEKLNKITVFSIFEWLNSNFFESYVELYFYKTTPDLTNKEINADFIFAIQPKSADWSLPFSINSYSRKFVDVWDEKSSLYCDVEYQAEPYDVSLMVNFSVTNIKVTLAEEIVKFEPIIKQCDLKTINILTTDFEDLLIASFNFPDELKISCKQYLLYFAQFLQDLGISATSNLKEEAGKVLFSVTPTDDVEALDKIREALAVYLKLPESPIVYDDSFAAMRLQQQIENLQHSQKMAVREIQVNEKLLLAQSDVIREKSVTISQQQTVIENQNKIIEKISSKSIMMDSAENKEELEEIYEGVKVGESKWLKDLTGIEFNPAKAIKTVVKNTFGKNESSSILGLNEKIENQKRSLTAVNHTEF